MLNTPWSNYEPAEKIENGLLLPIRQYKETFHLMFGLTFVHCIKVIVPNLSCAKNLIIWECCSCKTFDKFRVSQFVWHFIQINTLSCPRLRERTLMMEENTRPLKVISVSASGPSLCTLSETNAK